MPASARGMARPDGRDIPLGLMAYAYGNLDLAIVHVRQACEAPRAPAGLFQRLRRNVPPEGTAGRGRSRRAGERSRCDRTLPARWNNLGIVLQEALKLDESRLCLERALALEPDNAETLNNLGNTFKRLGLRGGGGEANGPPPQRSSPTTLRSTATSPTCCSTRANTTAPRPRRVARSNSTRVSPTPISISPPSQTARHRHAEALRCLDALLAFAPGHARALAAKALALKELDRLDEALDAAKRAALAAPESRSRTMRSARSSGDGRSSSRRLRRTTAPPPCRDPAQMDAIANRATLFMEFGRKAEARRPCWMPQRAFPDCAGHPVQPDRTQAVRRGRPADRADAVAARARGDFARRPDDAAFRPRQGLSRHRRLESGVPPLRRGQPTQALDLRLRSGCERALDGEHRRNAFRLRSSPAKADQGARSNLPVFVLGMPRSGTTLVEQILASHPNVHGAGELRRCTRWSTGSTISPPALPRLARDASCKRWARPISPA